jgi:hypothetical protein
MQNAQKTVTTEQHSTNGIYILTVSVFPYIYHFVSVDLFLQGFPRVFLDRSSKHLSSTAVHVRNSAVCEVEPSKFTPSSKGLPLDSEEITCQMLSVPYY